MPNPARQPAGHESQTSEERFDDLVELVTQRLEAGESVDPGNYLQFGPALVERLRRLLPTLQALASLQLAPSSESRSAPTKLGPSVAPAKDLGDFQLAEELGRGGMGIVFAAEQRSLARRVAVKVLSSASLLSDVALDRFRTEVRAAASLAHEHIVPMYAVGCERGIHFYAMKFIDGCTLADVIRERREGEARERELREGEAPAEPRPADDTIPLNNAALVTRAIQGETDWYRSIARLGMQAARALAHAHSQGIVHRDVKPSNLLIDQRGRLWLSDFGLARLEMDAGLTRTGDLLGTLRYMSPEQALGQCSELDARADIYSLGATLYECLTLEPAIRSAKRSEIIRQAADPHIPRLRSHDPHIPESLERIILQCLRTDPAERYKSAQNLADELERFLHGEKVQAKLPSPYQRARQWVARHPTTMLIAVATFATTSVCLLALALYVWSSDARLRGPPIARESPPLASDSLAPLDSNATPESPLMPRAKSRPTQSATTSENRRRPLFESLENRSLLAQLTFGTPSNMGPGVNSTAIEESPSLTDDGLSLVFSTSRLGTLSSRNILEATRASISEPFGNPVSAGLHVNASAVSTHPYISPDGLTLLFNFETEELGLFQATRSSRNEPFGAITSLGILLGNQKIASPSVSADGLTLYFTGWDESNTLNNIYQATRVGDTWGNVVMLESAINTPDYRDANPSISTDGLMLFFNSDRPGGFGRFDLYVSTRPTLTAPWENAVNLGPQVNTPYDDKGASTNADGSVLYFHSNRPGGIGADDLYQVDVGYANDTKFYVVNDASTDQTFEYEGNGSAIEDYHLASANAAPRGAASTDAGDKVWVVDANKNVFVYGPSGNLLGSWSAGSIVGNPDVQGIATNGTDIWIVDAKSDKVYRYADAASRLAGSQNAASNFSLNSGNKNPKDLATDGTHLWAVNDSSTDKVFKYSLTGSMAGNWTISGGGGSPTGITLDPSSPNHLWIVDNTTDRVYQYDGATARTSGSLAASTSFALVGGTDGNLNPQGIADPPVSGSPVLQVSAVRPALQPAFADLAIADLRPGRDATLPPTRKLSQPVVSTAPVVPIRTLDLARPQVIDEALKDYLRDEESSTARDEAELEAEPRS
jgi:serine/threonine protein kinase